MIYAPITRKDFVAEFVDKAPNFFSIPGLQAIYDYLDDMTDDADVDDDIFILEVSVVCRNFEEYGSLEHYKEMTDQPNIETMDDISPNLVTILVDDGTNETFIVTNP